MNPIEEQIIREYMYNDHADRMFRVKRDLNIAWVYNVYISMMLWIVSCLFNEFWVEKSRLDITYARNMGRPMPILFAPFTAITMFTALPIAIMSFLAGAYLIKRLNVIPQMIYILVLILTLLNLILKFEPIKTADTVILITYSAAGIWTEDCAIRCYKELDYLMKQEGFPEFNYLIDRGRHSRFVKYRERWLKTEQAVDHFIENERPLTDYNVIAADVPSKMDGISVDDEKKDSWFEGKRTGVSDLQGNMMDNIVYDGELPGDPETYEADERRIKRILPPL